MSAADRDADTSVDTPRRMRRSDMHEQDISRIFAQMRVREQTPRTTRHTDAKFSDPGPHPHAAVPPTPTSFYSLPRSHTYEAGLSSPIANSPSAAAYARRGALERPQRDSVADFGEEYMRVPGRSRTRTSLRHISSPRVREVVPPPPPVYDQVGEFDSPHTRNMHQALDLFRNQTLAQDELTMHLEESVELAAMLNQGLRNAIHRALDMQMSNALRMQEQTTPASLDADLSELLKYSDDHVRRLTDTLIVLARRRSPNPRRSTSFRHSTIGLPRSASRFSEWSSTGTQSRPETPTHRSAPRAREAMSALRRAASVRGDYPVLTRSYSTSIEPPVDDVSTASAPPNSLGWLGTSHRPMHNISPSLAHFPLGGQWPGAYGHAADHVAADDTSVDVD